jgi:phenylacetate-CoA ligase
MSWMDRIYSRAPVSVQNGLVTAYGVYWKWLRFGGSYRACLEAYRARERYSPEQWAAWQAGRLRELLTLAAGYVPYYRDTWSNAQKLATRAGDLASLPLLEKDPLRAEPRRFGRADARPFHLKHFLTSGSTGTPVETIWTVDEVRDSLAVREARSANWAGVSFGRPRATFSGRMVEPDPDSRGPFHRYNAAERQVYFSAFHLHPDTAGRYVDALRRHGVEWMTGYAVSFHLLARLILEQGLRVPPLKAVVTTSEKLTPEMRADMQQAYGCRIYEEYSTVKTTVCHD